MKEEKDNIQKIVDDIKKNKPEKERDPLFLIIGAILKLFFIHLL